MALLCKCTHVYFIDHRDYFSDIYKHIRMENTTANLNLSLSLFSIQTNNRGVKRKKNDDPDTNMESFKVKSLYEKSEQSLPKELRNNILDKYNLLDIKLVRNLSTKLFESTVFDMHGISGGNDSNEALKCKIQNEYFLIPPRCRFLAGSIEKQLLHLDGKKYDILIADPPWWNKYIRRLKSSNHKLSYSMMYNEDIANIPVKNLLADNCLVAVWCTNSPSNIAAVRDIIFPRWNVKYAATWYWLKLSVDMKPICNFSLGTQKQPYERLILGTVGDVNVDDEELIMSIPSALHSHKPPLLELLTPLLKKTDPQTLELFARYLLPDTTSVGYEPLKWQHISLYEEVT